MTCTKVSSAKRCCKGQSSHQAKPRARLARPIVRVLVSSPNPSALRLMQHQQVLPHLLATRPSHVNGEQDRPASGCMHSRALSIGAYLEVAAQIIHRRAAGQLDVDGGLHASAHGHQCRREADAHGGPGRLAQALPEQGASDPRRGRLGDGQPADSCQATMKGTLSTAQVASAADTRF